jgi:hypothetical protein
MEELIVNFENGSSQSIELNGPESLSQASEIIEAYVEDIISVEYFEYDPEEPTYGKSNAFQALTWVQKRLEEAKTLTPKIEDIPW